MQKLGASSGLYNQWGILHDLLYTSSDWTKATGGTVILPSIATTRLSFLQGIKRNNYKYIPLEYIFDVRKIINFLQNQLNMTACNLQRDINYDKFMKIFGVSKSLPSPPVDLNKWYIYTNKLVQLTPQAYAASVLSLFEKKNISNNNAHVIMYGHNLATLGAAFVPTNVTDYYHPYLIRSRNIAMAIQFNESIVTLARMINAKLLDMKATLIGIHLRVEQDWAEAKRLPAIRSYLNLYEKHIQKIMESVPKSSKIVLYVASGELPRERAGIIEVWLKSLNVQYFRKNGLCSKLQIDNLPHEAQAGIDGIVLETTDHFVGNALSSMSYIVSEFRNYHGLPSLFVSKPAYHLWWPMITPSYSDWRYAND